MAGEAREGRNSSDGVSLVEELEILEGRLGPRHAKETLSVFGARF